MERRAPISLCVQLNDVLGGAGALSEGGANTVSRPTGLPR